MRIQNPNAWPGALLKRMKHENAVIIEVLKHGSDDKQLDGRLEKLVNLGFLQSKWVGR